MIPFSKDHWTPVRQEDVGRVSGKHVTTSINDTNEKGKRSSGSTLNRTSLDQDSRPTPVLPSAPRHQFSLLPSSVPSPKPLLAGFALVSCARTRAHRSSDGAGRGGRTPHTPTGPHLVTRQRRNDVRVAGHLNKIRSPRNVFLLWYIGSVQKRVSKFFRTKGRLPYSLFELKRVSLVELKRHYTYVS